MEERSAASSAIAEVPSCSKSNPFLDVCPDADQAEIKEEQGEDETVFSYNETILMKVQKRNDEIINSYFQEGIKKAQKRDHDNAESFRQKRIKEPQKRDHDNAESFRQKRIKEAQKRHHAKAESLRQKRIKEVQKRYDDFAYSFHQKRIMEALKGVTGPPYKKMLTYLLMSKEKFLHALKRKTIEEPMECPYDLSEYCLNNDQVYIGIDPAVIKEEMKKEFTAINIYGANVAVDMTQNHLRVHKKHAKHLRVHKKRGKHDYTILGTFYGLQFAIAFCLGSPLEVFLKWESTGKVKSPLNFKEALLVLLPSITLSTMFFLSFIYTTILTRPLDSRLLANSIQLLLLLYYILVLASTMSGSSVLWGSIQMPALLFVSGGAIGLMMLTGSIIMAVKFYFARRFFLN